MSDNQPSNRKQAYNRRSFPRQSLKYPVHVDSQVTGREFGQILDISLEGSRILCSVPVKRDHIYELSFRMPKEICNDEIILFEAKSVWTCPHGPTGCLAGFKILSFWQQSNNHLALSSAINDYENYLSTY